jgi:hypothetical protein
MANMRRVGTLTSACTLLALGLLLWIDILDRTSYFLNGLHFWPLIIIGIGLELLVAWLLIRRKGYAESMRLDGRSLGLLFLVGVFAVYFYDGANQAAKDVQPPTQESLFKVTKKDVPLPTQVAPLLPQTKQVVINNPLGKIEVVGGTGSALRIDGMAHISAAAENGSTTGAAVKLYPYLDIGDKAVIEVRTDKASDRPDAKKPVSPGTVDLKVEVPKGYELVLYSEFGDTKVSSYKGALTVVAKSGDIVADALEGPVNAETGSGEINMHSVTGNVQLRTGQGGVTLQDIKGDVGISSESGDCRIAQVTGKLDVSANLGKLELDAIGGDATLNSNSGVVTVKNPQKSLTASVMNGDIQVGGKVLGPWTMTTTNGKVKLEIPKDSAIKFLGETNVGVIRGPTKQSQNSSTKPGAHVTEEMGAGTWPVTARSYNGSIFVDLK